MAVGLLIFAGLTFTLGDAAFLIGSGIGIVKTAVLPKWLGWVAIILGVAALTPAGFFAFALLGLWTLVASVMLAMRADTA